MIGPLALLKVDSRRNNRRLHHLVGEWQAHGVVSVCLDGLQDGLVVLAGETMGHFVGGFEAIPVDARNADLLIVGIEYLASAGMPITGSRCGQATGWLTDTPKANTTQTILLFASFRNIRPFSAAPGAAPALSLAASGHSYPRPTAAQHFRYCCSYLTKSLLKPSATVRSAAERPAHQRGRWGRPRLQPADAAYTSPQNRLSGPGNHEHC